MLIISSATVSFDYISVLCSTFIVHLMVWQVSHAIQVFFEELLSGW